MATISDLKKIKEDLIKKSDEFQHAMNDAEKLGLSVEVNIHKTDVTSFGDRKTKKVFTIICETTIDIDAVDE